MLKPAVFAALVLGLLLPYSAARSGELIRTACVKTDDRNGQLNVRSAPSMSAPVVSRIGNGQCGVTLIGYCGRPEKATDWCTIRFGQIRFGIVAARYLVFKAAE